METSASFEARNAPSSYPTKSREGKVALERVSHRINALGQLYSKLSNANTVEAVDAATYLDELC
jgi:two-component sensor histidine kinase